MKDEENNLCECGTEKYKYPNMSVCPNCERDVLMSLAKFYCNAQMEKKNIKEE